MLAATIVAPGHAMALPLMPAFIAPQDGALKQDCERNAAKRWLATHAARVKDLRPIFLGDDLLACQPIAAAITTAGGDFLLTAKRAHRRFFEHIRTITAYLVFPNWQTLMQTLIDAKPPPEIAAQIAL